MTLRWTCLSCGWSETTDAPDFPGAVQGGPGGRHVHYLNEFTKAVCEGPIIAVLCDHPHTTD